MSEYRNPLMNSVERAEGLLDHIDEICHQFELAIEQRRLAFDAYQIAKETYEQQEAEFVVDVMFTDERYSKAKNAEARKAVMDVCLIEARNSGPLARPWRVMNDAKNSHDATDMAYTQMEARFKAVRVAAGLQEALLRAASLR